MVTYNLLTEGDPSVQSGMVIFILAKLDKNQPHARY